MLFSGRRLAHSEVLDIGTPEHDVIVHLALGRNFLLRVSPPSFRAKRTHCEYEYPEEVGANGRGTSRDAGEKGTLLKRHCGLLRVYGIQKTLISNFALRDKAYPTPDVGSACLTHLLLWEAVTTLPLHRQS
jgi:hypothetical protein